MTGQSVSPIFLLGRCCPGEPTLCAMMVRSVSPRSHVAATEAVQDYMASGTEELNILLFKKFLF